MIGSEVLTRLLSTQTNDAQRGGKGHKPLPTLKNTVSHQLVSKENRWEEMKGDGTRCVLRNLILDDGRLAYLE